MAKVQASATEAIVAFGSLVMPQKRNNHICCLTDQGAKASIMNLILAFPYQLLVGTIKFMNSHSVIKY
jgi:hypothetical protein